MNCTQQAGPIGSSILLGPIKQRDRNLGVIVTLLLGIYLMMLLGLGLTQPNGGGSDHHTTLARGATMATPTVNFISYNSTGINSIKTSWIRDLCKVTNANFLGIQEHFKSSKSVDKFFKEQFPDMLRSKIVEEQGVG